MIKRFVVGLLLCLSVLSLNGMEPENGFEIIPQDCFSECAAWVVSCKDPGSFIESIRALFNLAATSNLIAKRLTLDEVARAIKICLACNAQSLDDICNEDGIGLATFIASYKNPNTLIALLQKVVRPTDNIIRSLFMMFCSDDANIAIIETLLKNNTFDYFSSYKDENNSTPLHCAAYNKCSNIVSAILASVPKAFTTFCLVMQTDDSNNTPLHLTFLKPADDGNNQQSDDMTDPHEDILYSLLAYIPKPVMRSTLQTKNNNENKTIFILAQELNNQDIIHLLEPYWRAR